MPDDSPGGTSFEPKEASSRRDAELSPQDSGQMDVDARGHDVVQFHDDDFASLGQ